MNVDNASDLFDIKLTDEGVRNIKKFSRLAEIVVFIGVFNCLATLITAIPRIFRGPYDYSDIDLIQQVYFNFSPYFNLIFCVVLSIQLFYYWQIKKSLAESIANKNELTFNRSFSALVKNAIWAIVGLGFSVLFSIFDAVVYFKYYH